MHKPTERYTNFNNKIYFPELNLYLLFPKMFLVLCDQENNSDVEGDTLTINVYFV